MLTQERLKELFTYDSITGVFTWNVNRGNNPTKGKEAGHLRKDGYLSVNINKKQYFLHRLAWLYEYGFMPSKNIDHINHNRSDNRISNLNSVTTLENNKNQSIPSNNRSGVIGVSYYKKLDKWLARIGSCKTYKHLGYFDRFEDAVKARKEAENKQGFHINHGLKEVA